MRTVILFIVLCLPVSLYSQDKDSIVHISSYITTVTLEDGTMRIGHAGCEGTGFIVSMGSNEENGYVDGLIGTAAHVVAGATDIHIRFSTKVAGIKAKVHKIDTEKDLALLSVKIPSSLRPVVMGESLLQKSITLVGMKGDYTYECHKGILKYHREHSAITDAEVIPGNSGGPVFDEEGKVVGVISAGYNIKGVGPSLWPSVVTRIEFLQELMKEADNGEEATIKVCKQSQVEEEDRSNGKVTTKDRPSLDFRPRRFSINARQVLSLSA
jgi:S1-C subfamily serine protease